MEAKIIFLASAPSFFYLSVMEFSAIVISKVPFIGKFIYKLYVYNINWY